MEQLFKGTKGQWHRAIKRGGIGILVGITRNNFQTLCEIRHSPGYGMTKEEVEANANLISAAPDLLETLVEVANLLEEHEPNWYLRKHYNRITAALNKALSNTSPRVVTTKNNKIN